MHYGPKTNTAGLVFAVDAADKNSYVGSGTTWKELIKPISGTLANMTFSSDGAGSFILNGSNSSATFTNNTALDNQTFTIEAWIKPTTVSQNGFIFEKGSVNTQYSFFLEGATFKLRCMVPSFSDLNVSNTYLTANKWQHVAATRISGDRRIFVNGIQRGNDTATGTVSTNAGGQFIGIYGGGGYPFDGSIAMVKVYNRVLSPFEILQNYNAQKARFK